MVANAVTDVRLMIQIDRNLDSLKPAPCTSLPQCSLEA